MAVVLGNYTTNKTIKAVNETIQHEMKLENIKLLITKLDKQIELANDIYDTYHYINKNDEKFGKQLWRLLCRNNVGEIDINSYFSWGIYIGGYVRLSKHGIGIYNQSIKPKLLLLNDDEKNLFRGKVMLLDYLAHFDLEDKILDIVIRELQTFIGYFENYANTFFECVSNYKVPKI